MPMYGDELTLVYDTFSILKTGHDQTGRFFPVTFPMRGGSPGGYVYFSLPFVSIFGLSEIGVRTLSLISGLGISVLMYLLGKKIFSENIGLVAGFLTSVSLWDIYLSRGGFETHFALFLSILGVVCFLYKKYLPWAISWGLAILTYPTFKLTLPLMFLVILWYVNTKDVVKNKSFMVAIIILALFGGVVVREAFRGGGEQRFLEINIFSNGAIKEQLVQKINEERTLSTLPDNSKPLFYNKPLEYSRVILENYMDNISIKFLYLRGDGNPRHNPGEWGMLYLVELPLLFVGIVYLWREKRRELVFISFWILIAPLASMLIDRAHGLRNNLMLPAFILISSYALTKLPKKLSLLFMGLILIQFIIVMQRVYFLAPNKFAGFWSASAKKASLEAVETRKTGKRVTLLTNIDNIEYAYPVYAKIDPNLVIDQYGKYPKVYDNVIISDK